MSRLSDRTLRRSSWVGFSVLPLSIVLLVAVAIVDGTGGATGWSSGTTGDLVFAVALCVFPLVGLLILRSQPRNTVGWVLQGIGLIWGLSGIADNYTTYGLLVNPGSLPGAAVVAAFNQGVWAPAIGVMGTYLILLFPDGHLPSPRWRPLAWLSGVVMAAVIVIIALRPGKFSEGSVPGTDNPLGWSDGERFLTLALAVSLPLIPLCILGCAGALVVRFRRSRGVERQQLKWLVSAAAVVAGSYLLTMLLGLLTSRGAIPENRWVTGFQVGSIASFVLLPIAIGVAIQRHGLYELDVVVNRTLVYLSLTATLALVYLGSVLTLQALLHPLTQQSDLAVAISTLAVAALFGPARRAIQELVDRRFYRRKYDAVCTLEDFAIRLRHEVDLDAVGHDLRGVVRDSVQPAHVTLWVRP